VLAGMRSASVRPLERTLQVITLHDRSQCSPFSAVAMGHCFGNTLLWDLLRSCKIVLLALARQSRPGLMPSSGCARGPLPSIS
jgi:hypothetical protein